MKIINELNREDLENKKVLLRVDFNVPVENGLIQDEFRIKSHKETINYLIENGARVAMVCHISNIDSFENISEKIGEILGHKIVFIPDCIGDTRIKAIKSNNLVLLENVRKYKEEESNDIEFSKKLTDGFDIYVNDAFATAHRRHSSIVGVTQFLDSYAGLLIEKETRTLTEAIESPIEGKTMVLGGAKISTKLPVIKNFVSKSEDILIGGALANDFILKKGFEVGKSKVDLAELSLIDEIDSSVLNLPRDYIVSENTDGSTEAIIKAEDSIEKNEIILDIGPETAEHYGEIIRNSKIVIWNGPMGLSEIEQFAKGTRTIAKAVAMAKNAFIGGGDTIRAVDDLGMLDSIKHVSTGGGAMLDFLANIELPGLEALGYYK